MEFKPDNIYGKCSSNFAFSETEEGELQLNFCYVNHEDNLSLSSWSMEDCEQVLASPTDPVGKASENLLIFVLCYLTVSLLVSSGHGPYSC
jgi:hypothetical protein